MTQQELQTLLDKSFTIPVDIDNATFPNNTPYQQINALNQTGFTFTARELLHAIGSKTAALPANNQDECVNAAYLYSHILDFSGQNLGYKTDLVMDSDLQTNRSNEIGIGIGCLLANKQFNVNWDTLESIKGQGKRFDYRATNVGQNYAYEFKGTKHRGKQNEQIQNGLEKKTEMHNRNENYDVELIISTFLGPANQQPRIILADPPFQGFEDEFTEDAETIYSLRHLSRLAQFIGNPPLGRILYMQSRELIEKKSIDQIQEFGERLYLKEIRVIENLFETKKLIPLNFENTNYVGRWISYWQPQRKITRKQVFEMPEIAANKRLEVFQGVRRDLYELMTNNEITDLKSKLRYERTKIQTPENIEFVTFTDGSIMGYRLLDE